MPHHEDSEFACDHCGASEPRAGLEYDSLGYPICPRCGESDRSFAISPVDDGSPPAPTPLTIESESAEEPTDSDQFRWVASR